MGLEGGVILCEDFEEEEEDYEGPDCMEVAKDHWIERRTFVCEVCYDELHHDKEKGWYCRKGHENKEPKCRMELGI